MTSEYFPDQNKVFYFWKGRVALYVILKALNLGPGDEVILPGFTCVVVPNAIMYTGATPVYADIDAATYNLSATTVEPLITKHTRVILAQNTFGLSADLEPIMALADKRGLTVVEDCAHGLGGFYRGRRNGAVAHAAFFSAQWSKPISTGLGGIAYTQDDNIAKNIRTILARMPQPRIKEQVILRMQMLMRPLADFPLFHYPLVQFYRFLTQKSGLSVGSSTHHELETNTMPPGYLKQMSAWQLRKWQRGLALLDRTVKQRQTTAAYYDSFFTALKIQPPHQPDYAEHSMLRYAVRVPEKDKLLARAQQFRIPIGDWFVSPLHPVVGDLRPWKYEQGQCPIAEQACREVVNLFTDNPLSYQQLQQLFYEKRNNR